MLGTRLPRARSWTISILLGGLSIFFVHLSFLYPDITAITAEATIFLLAVAALAPAAAPDRDYSSNEGPLP